MVDSHAHPLQYGHSRQLQLQGSKSIDEVIRRVEHFVKTNGSSLPEGAWVEGLGWDQNLWDVKEYPSAVHLATLLIDVAEHRIRQTWTRLPYSADCRFP